MTTGRDRGSATVWVLALAGVLGLAALAGLLVAGAVVARHRAGAAADLAALAAAGSAVAGEADPCAAATRIAEANGAHLRRCAVDAGAVAEVVTVVDVRLGPLGVRQATGRARAGPAAPD